MNVNIEIPKTLYVRTQQEVVLNGKVYIVEVYPKLRSVSPFWPVIGLVVLTAIGFLYILLYMRPTDPLPWHFAYFSLAFVVAFLGFFIALFRTHKLVHEEETIGKQ